MYPCPLWREYDKPYHLGSTEDDLSPLQKINASGRQDQQCQRGSQPDPPLPLARRNRATCLTGDRSQVRRYFLSREGRFHWRNKPVSTPSHRLNIPRLFGRVTHHLPQLRHGGIETTLEVNKSF